MMQRIGCAPGLGIFHEIVEFSGFSSEAQSYIRKSLDVASKDQRAIARWANSVKEASTIRAQSQIYRALDSARAILLGAEPEIDGKLLSLLIMLSSFDLSGGDLDGFDPYRFLYERLLGASARPWLPSAFCAAALMPQVKPVRRISLLRTLGEATVQQWADTEPHFHPEQIGVTC